MEGRDQSKECGKEVQQMVSGTQQRGDPHCSVVLRCSKGSLRRSEPEGEIMVASGTPQRSPLRHDVVRSPIPKRELEKSNFLGHWWARVPRYKKGGRRLETD